MPAKQTRLIIPQNKACPQKSNANQFQQQHKQAYAIDFFSYFFLNSKSEVTYQEWRFSTLVF